MHVAENWLSTNIAEIVTRRFIAAVEAWLIASSLAGRHGEDHDEDRSRDASRHGVRPRIVRDFLDREDQRAWVVDDIAQRRTTVAPRRIAVIARTKVNSNGSFRSRCSSSLVRRLRRHRFPLVGEVYVIRADDGSFLLAYHDCPDEERVEKIGVDARLSYVAASRARDRLTILCGIRPSPFLMHTH